jgi:hypothetical protein
VLLKFIRFCSFLFLCFLFSLAPEASDTRLTPAEAETVRAARSIWQRQEREAWATLQRLKPDANCKCGESWAYIAARERWSDIQMARSYFERMEMELGK